MTRADVGSDTPCANLPAETGCDSGWQVGCFDVLCWRGHRWLREWLDAGVWGNTARLLEEPAHRGLVDR